MRYRNIPVAVAVLFLLACTSSERPSRPEETRVQKGGDIITAGSMPHVPDTVPGDVIAAGAEIGFTGVTGSDYLGAGGRQSIDGQVGGSIRAAGGEVVVSATVGKNATLAGGAVQLSQEAVIARNAYLAGGRVQMDGTVQGTLTAAAGLVTINGTVGGDAEVVAGELRIGPNAQLSGNLKYQVPKEKVFIDPTARIAGTVTAVPVRERSPVGMVVWALVWIAAFLITGAVVVALLPRATARAADVVRQRFAASLIVGIAVIVAIPVLALIALITLVGFPLAFISLGLYLLLLYLASIPVCIWLGRRLLGSRVDGTTRKGTVWQFLAGAFVLELVSLIPVLGWLIAMIATATGLGAIMLRLRGWREPAGERVEVVA